MSQYPASAEGGESPLNVGEHDAPAAINRRTPQAWRERWRFRHLSGQTQQISEKPSTQHLERQEHPLRTQELLAHSMHSMRRQVLRQETLEIATQLLVCFHLCPANDLPKRGAPAPESPESSARDGNSSYEGTALHASDRRAMETTVG